ncbi:Crp/Fnr family transcriptional regulator [Pseudomonas sp. MWU12-2323]|uniref:Crp/Fnr family transcriptional regulator n=1 Tax=Pseudomonas sp. MWU12-2323 TaxID=2651296 RepID=UPI00128DDCA3|nr:Crp/Fnr family transcriptional regulator [Pseudomonas sp. MWU12-2323]MPQ69316.1 hypothetical protein [Pseudomonas sp. MWU12-2323]
MMAGIGFAGSSGIMDVPAPSWIEGDEPLFSQWGQFLIAMIKHGTVETFRRTEAISMASSEFGLLIEGGVFATDEPKRVDGRRVLVQFFQRGDLFAAAVSSNLQFQLTPHCRTICLIVRERALDAFKNEFLSWARLRPLLNDGLAQAYSQALIETVGRDQDRIRRVLAMLAKHPTSTDTKLGSEIEAGKQLIRDLAGVQKRSATRAFQALVEAGCVEFHGYKRLFYKEPQREPQTVRHKHQQTGAVCQRSQQRR